MNNEQQPNVSPDFGYIINQQSPLEKKPGIDKRIVIIVVCAVLALIMLLLSVLIKPKSTQTSITGPAAQQVLTLNQALKDKDYQKAAGVVGSTLSDSEKSTIADNFEQAARFVNYQECTVTNVTANGQGVDVDDVCMSLDKTTKYTVTYTLVKSGENYYVTSSKYGAVKS